MPSLTRHSALRSFEASLGSAVRMLWRVSRACQAFLRPRAQSPLLPSKQKINKKKEREEMKLFGGGWRKVGVGEDEGG